MKRNKERMVYGLWSMVSGIDGRCDRLVAGGAARCSLLAPRTMPVGRLTFSLRSSAFMLLLAFAPSAIAERPAPPVTVPAGGPPFVSQLVSLGADGRVVLDTASGQRTLQPADFVSWGTRAEAEKGAQVMLADGSLLVVDVIDIDGEFLSVESDLWDETRLPLELVRSVLFYPPAAAAERDRLFRQFATATEASDQLLLDNGDTLTGTILSLDQRQIRLQTKNAELELGRERILGMVFDPSLLSTPRPSARWLLIGLADGSRVHAVTAEVSADEGRLELAGGVPLVPYDGDGLLTAIRLVRPMGYGVTYLSDLNPLGYKHVPYLELAWDYRRDHSVIGSQLRCHGELFTKGLGMHSTSRLAYRVPADARRFAAELGIDDAAGRSGSVGFRVFTDDGSGTWHTVFTSPVIRGGDAPHPLQLDLEGIRRISLVVDFADHGDILDHADWLNARFER